MKRCIVIFLGIILTAGTADSGEFFIPHAQIDAPVVHVGNIHVLSCKDTYLVLDGSMGMSMHVIGSGMLHDVGVHSRDNALAGCHLQVTMVSGGKTIELDQYHDRAARLQIIDQGSGRVAARSFFTLYDENGIPHGSGTLDMYVYEGRIHLLPSLHIDDEGGDTFITRAGFTTEIPGGNVELISEGMKLMPKEGKRSVSFGDDSSGFSVMVNNLGRPSVKIGWLRNKYPPWMYLREIDTNPETDELYEKWPPWITQRGGPLSWIPSKTAGLSADYTGHKAERLSFFWVDGDSLEVPAGSYYKLNGTMALFLGENGFDADARWKNHREPQKPSFTTGVFRYYNEFEGVYEVDSTGGDVAVTFSNTKGVSDLPFFVRVWNLAGRRAYEARMNGKVIPSSLYNDGDIVEDPMVSIVKNASGPSNIAGLAFKILKGDRAKITLTGKPGMQFTYQMYSDLETYEAWTDNCGADPLFRFHLTRGSLYHVTLPGKEDYAIFKLPLFWIKNGVNTNTFMNSPRGFTVNANGPDRISFTLTSVNLHATGLSTYTVTARSLAGRLSFDVTADFTALGSMKTWTSLEYCDLYPFDTVYRRIFHYDDVTFLKENGEFDRVGTGAWSGRFETHEETDRLGYYAESVPREGPGNRCPDSTDGAVWILGDNPERGNIMYRRGLWTPSKGARSVFSLCNAWVDIHNAVVRADPHAPEHLDYTVEVFGGAIPPPDELTAMYRAAAGGGKSGRVTRVVYDESGHITGFERSK